MTLNLNGANKRREARAAQRAYLADPVVRDRRNEARRQKRSDPEYRAAELARDRETLRIRPARYEAQLAKHREWAAQNTDHVRGYGKAHWAKYRERGLELNRQWHERNPLSRRMREAKRRAAAGGRVECLVEDVERMMVSQGGLCFWTGDSLADGFEVDHIVPLSRGGKHELGNLALCTASANRTKYNKMPDEFWNETWSDYAV